MAHLDGLELAFTSTGAASGTGRADHPGHLLLLPLDGTKGAHASAQASLLAQVLVHRSGDGLDGEPVLVQQDRGPRRCGAGLGNALPHILRALGGPGDIDALGRGVDWSQLGVGLLQKAAGRLGQADHLADNLGVGGGLGGTAVNLLAGQDSRGITGTIATDREICTWHGLINQEED